MTAPYIPTPLAVPIVNPATGSTGPPPIPYISNTYYRFAPTAVDSSNMVPGASSPVAASNQSLADTIRRASRWADSICFGADPSSKGASLAASLSVESVRTHPKSGELRLICDYRPILEVVGIDVGFDPSTTCSIGPALAAMTQIKRRTIAVPWFGPNVVFRTNDSPGVVPNSGTAPGGVYAVWSYVNGYPHTSLAASVVASATTCVVASTDGNGGAWGITPASGAFPGTSLNVIDGQYTEAVFVTGVTPGMGTTTLTTSPFQYAHTVPTAPDFIPVTTMPDDVGQAVISLTNMLIKTRGVRGMVMPSQPGGRPSGASKEMGQAGALEDYEVARRLLVGGGYVVRMKTKN